MPHGGAAAGAHARTGLTGLFYLWGALAWERYGRRGDLADGALWGGGGVVRDGRASEARDQGQERHVTRMRHGWIQGKGFEAGGNSSVARKVHVGWR